MIPKFFVALAFDDGYVEHYPVALLLSRLGIRATFFIITHLSKFEGRTLLTSRPEFIEEISKMGHEIDSHAKTHPNLTTVPLHRVEEEARESRQMLEDLIGKEVKGFAYPYGAYNASIIRIISKYYKFARGAGMHYFEHPFKTKPEKRYTLETFTRQRKAIRSFLRLPIKPIIHEYEKCSGIIITLHQESLCKILALIACLKLFPGGTIFTTLNEFLEV